MKPNFLHQIIGKTRTDKILICAISAENAIVIPRYFQDQCFSVEELLDAFAVFEYLSIRAERKNDPSKEVYSKHSLEIWILLSTKDYEGAKSQAGVVTLFDLIRLGRNLVNIEFKDF